ncbi:MAG TPA: methyltransferase [Burkholderiaceae bacterium]|nr:methyltransferase [Burkholderiaceae bacterium]
MKRTRTRIADGGIDLSEEAGVRYLHFGSRWIQGAMRIRRPYDIELAYVRDMMAWLLFLEPPPRLLQLGLGAGALTKFCHRQLPATDVTVVELQPAVIACARQWFAVPPDDERLQIVHGDAGRFLQRPRNRGRFGVVQVDLYDREARGPALDSPEFYRDCAAAIAEPGMLVVNLFGEAASFPVNRRRIEREFDGRVLALPPVEAGNLILLAFRGPPLAVTRHQLFERALEVERRWRLPARGWVKALGAAATRV